MPLLWAAISGHGFGHAAQVVPVLNELGRQVPRLRVLLRTTVPASFFQDRLSIPWQISPVQQDIGCVQDGPMTIDVEATWREHDRFHADWHERVGREAAAMRSHRPALVLADTPYLALAAGRQAGCFTAALASFTWDLVLADYPASAAIDRTALLHSMRQAYAQADLALRITPAPKLDVFPEPIDIGPIASPATSERSRLADRLQITPDEHTVLIGFGGIPLPALPLSELLRQEALQRFRFLVDRSIAEDQSRIIPISSLPFSFKTVLASVDVIMTKPGYGTLVEAVVLQTPVAYVRRYNFADEQPLVDYLHRHGRGIELAREDFSEGRWGDALNKALRIPPPSLPPPPPTGARDAAALLAPHLC